MKPHAAMDAGDTSYPPCLWHSAADCSSPEEMLESYAEQAAEGSPLFQSLEADLVECRDCMGVYHGARERLIQRKLAYDQELFELEGRRLTETLSRDSEEQDILVPVTEVLWHPFLLFNPNLAAAFCRRLMELDKSIGLEGFLPECIPTMYLLLIHPKGEVRDLAQQCLQQPEYHITCDNYEDISQVLHWVVSAQIATGQRSEVVRFPSQVKKLPAHLLCAASQVAYWQGVAYLLEIFNVEALKHGFMMSKDLRRLIPTLIDHLCDEGVKDGPSAFWPQLQCLTFLMDTLGSTMWQDVSKTNIENIFDIVRKQTVFVAAIRDLRQSHIEELPSSFGTLVGPSEPFLWMAPYINSLLDFGTWASGNITGVLNCLCSYLTGLLKIGSNSNLSLDLLMAKFMRALVQVLQSLLKTLLLGRLAGEIRTSLWLKTCLGFLRRNPPVRSQQGVSVVVDVANACRQFLIDIFKLAQKNKPNVGRSTRYIKMLGLPLQLSAGAGSIFSPSDSQMKLWEMDMDGRDFDGCVAFVEETLQGHSSAGSASSFGISQGRRDAARISASSTQSLFSQLKRDPHRSKLGDRLSATPKTTTDVSAHERNLFTDVGEGTSPVHATKPPEEVGHAPSVPSKLVSPCSVTSANKGDGRTRLALSSTTPSMHPYKPSTSKPFSSSDEIIFISDVTSDEASSSNSRLPAGGLSRQHPCGQDSSDDDVSYLPEDVFVDSSLSHRLSADSHNSPDSLPDETWHAQDAEWQPTVRMEVIPELQGITEPEGQFSITSEEPLRIRRTEHVKVKRELDSPTDIESSVTDDYTRSSRNKWMKTKHPGRVRVLKTSSDETSSGDDSGPSSSLGSTPPNILHKLWQSSSSSTRSSPWGSVRRYPRDRLSRTRRLRKGHRLLTNSSDEDESPPRGPAGIIKALLPEDGASSSDEAFQSLLQSALVKKEGSQESRRKLIWERPEEDTGSSPQLVPSDDNVLDAPITVSDDSDSAPPEFDLSSPTELKDRTTEATRPGAPKGVGERKQSKENAGSSRRLLPVKPTIDYLADALSPVSDDSDSVPLQHRASKDWQTRNGTTGASRPGSLEEVGERKQSKNNAGSSRRLLPVKPTTDYLADALSPVSDDSDNQDFISWTGSDGRRSQGASPLTIKEEGSEKGTRQRHPSAKKNARSTVNRPRLSDNQAMDYLEGNLSPISDNSDSNNSSDSTILLTRRVCKTERISSSPDPMEYDILPSPELKHPIELVSATSSTDIESSDGDSNNSALPNILLTSSPIRSDDSTCMCPSASETSETAFADQQQDVKPAIHFVRFRRTTALLPSLQSSQGFSDSLTFTADHQDSDEVIDLDNYNCSELYDEDPLSQLIEISSDGDDGDDVDLDRTEALLTIDLDAPVKQEPDDDFDLPAQAMMAPGQTHSCSLMEDNDYLCALQDHEEATWFNDNEYSCHHDGYEERTAVEDRPSGGRTELKEKYSITEEPSSCSSSPPDDGAPGRAVQDHKNPVWFDDSPRDKEAEVPEVEQREKQEKHKQDAAFKKVMEEFDSMIAAAAERKLQATAQQTQRKTGEAHGSKRIPRVPVKRLMSLPQTSQSGQTHASTSVPLEAHASVVENAAGKPGSPLPKVRGSWKPASFHQPEFAPADAEPLKRFRGSGKDPELADAYVLDGSQPQRKPSTSHTEEDRPRTVQSWANRFSSRMGSLVQTMKEGPPPAQKGHQGKAGAAPPPKIRHLSGPPSLSKSGKSLDTNVTATRALPSFVETLPHYAQTVYAHATVPTPSVPQISAGQSSGGSVLPSGSSTSSSSGNGVVNRNEAAHVPAPQTDSEPGTPLLDEAPSVSQPRFQFFTSDPQTVQTATSLPSLVGSGLIGNSSTAPAVQSGRTSPPASEAQRAPTEAPSTSSAPAPHQRVTQARRSSRGEASNAKPQEATRTTAPPAALQPQAAVKLPKTAPFSEEHLFYWVIGWSSQWLDIYGPSVEAFPQAILADCPYEMPLDVPVSFDSLEEYYTVFIPLLLHEIWAQIQNKTDANHPSLTAAFVECKKDHERPTGSVLKCAFLVTANDGVFPISPKDVVLVSPCASAPCSWCPLLTVVTGVNPVVPKNTGARRLANHNAQDNGGNDCQADEKLFEISLLILAKNEETNRVLISSTGHDVQLKFLHSLVSAARQFQSLMSLPKCGLLTSDILRFRRMDVFCPSPPCAVFTYKSQKGKALNSCQLQAVDVASVAVANPDTLPRICLVNGVPGTGKTKTVTGLVKKILEGHKENHHQQCLPGRQSGNSRAKPPPILLCAPTNNSVNILLRRLSGEIQTAFLHQAKLSGRGAPRRYHVVRLCGRSTVVHDSIKRFSLDSQVQASRHYEAKEILLDSNHKTQQREKLQRKITVLGTDCGRHNLKGERDKLFKAQEERNRLIKDLRKVNAQLEDLKRRKEEVDTRPSSHYERLILDSADVVCCTVNLSGSELLQGTSASRDGARRRMKFSCVIVDEANQCSELDSLIPLQNCSMKVVLVGDSRMIPAPIASAEAHRHGLHRSLFERLCSWFPSSRGRSPPIIRLELQHRMHPDIATFPSQHFYRGGLRSEKNMAKRRLSFFLHPYLIFNVIQSKESLLPPRSFTNDAELKMVLALYRRICTEKRKDSVMSSEQLSMGIISPYKDQASYISVCLKRAEEELIAASSGNFQLPQVETSTMDVFQGREKDVLIVTCVRTEGSAYRPGPSCGLAPNFLCDRKKMNFILTRARYCLYIVANLSSLRNSSDWGALAADAEKRHHIVHVRGDDLESATSRCKKASHHRPPPAAATQTGRASAGEPRRPAEQDASSPQPPEGGGLAPESGTSTRGSAGTPSDATPSTEVPKVHGLSPAIKSRPAVKAKKTNSSARKKVTFQQALDKGTSPAGPLLVPRPMQQNQASRLQGKPPNPYRMSPLRSPTPRRSPKLPHYRHVLKRKLLMAGGIPNRQPRRRSPARGWENKWTASTGQGSTSRCAGPTPSAEASLGSPSTSLGARDSPVPDPASFVHPGPRRASLATTPTKNHLPVRAAAQSRSEPSDSTPAGTSNSGRERTTSPGEAGVPTAQPTPCAGAPGPARGLPARQPEGNPAGTGSVDQLQMTIESFKRRAGKEKRTMPLSGLQPDPKMARRRQRSGPGAAAPPATASPAAGTGIASCSDGPIRIPYLPSSDSE